MYVTEAGGHTYGTSPEQAPEARILEILPGGRTRVVYEQTVPLDVLRRVEFGQPVPSEGIVPPLLGITFNPRDGLLYVASRQRYATLDPETGAWNTIIDGLPSWGEFLNTKPIFDEEGKMYFVLSSQGNSGTIETHWIKLVDTFSKPGAHEVPCCGKPAWASGCSGGLRRPIMAEWGPDGALYVVDFGVVHFSEQGMNAEPNTGVLWKVTRTGR